jgi:hypothetical protein
MHARTVLAAWLYSHTCRWNFGLRLEFHIQCNIRQQPMIAAYASVKQQMPHRYRQGLRHTHVLCLARAVMTVAVNVCVILRTVKETPACASRAPGAIPTGRAPLGDNWPCVELSHNSTVTAAVTPVTLDITHHSPDSDTCRHMTYTSAYSQRCVTLSRHARHKQSAILCKRRAHSRPYPVAQNNQQISTTWNPVLLCMQVVKLACLCSQLGLPM